MKLYRIKLLRNDRIRIINIYERIYLFLERNEWRSFVTQDSLHFEFIQKSIILRYIHDKEYSQWIRFRMREKIPQCVVEFLYCNDIAFRGINVRQDNIRVRLVSLLQYLHPFFPFHTNVRKRIILYNGNNIDYLNFITFFWNR